MHEDPELPTDESFDAAEFLAGLVARNQHRQDPPCDDATYPNVAALVNAVARFYLNSGDFNGMPVRQSKEPHTVLQAAIGQGAHPTGHRGGISQPAHPALGR